MLTLMTSEMDFATKRGGEQRSLEDRLVGSARFALNRYRRGEEDWYTSLLDNTERIVRREFQKLAGVYTSARLREEIGHWRAGVEEVLAETKKPTAETISQQSQFIAALLSTSAVNLAMEVAGIESGEAVEKVWVSMEDAKVRPSHAAANGQRVPLGEKFTVGGVKMDRPGDLSAPVHQTANCRCLLAVAAAGSLAAAVEEPREGRLVVFLPSETDPVNALSSEDQAHITTLWFGENEDLDIERVRAAVAAFAANFDPFTVRVAERGTLGDEDADVLFLNGDDIVPARDLLLDSDILRAGVEAVEQYPQWTPHLTLGYPETPALEGEPPPDITIDRLALWVGSEHHVYTLGEVMEDENEQEPTVPAPEDRLDYVDDAIPFWGVLAPEGVESGDGRMFTEEALRSRPLPLPLAFQRSSEAGHDGSVKVANIERVWRREGKVYGSGRMLTTVPEAEEVIGMMAESQGRMGVSIDADDGEMEMRLRDGSAFEGDALEALGSEEELLTVFTTARICGATLCHIPAFHEAFISLGETPEEFTEGEDLAVLSRAEKLAAVVAAPGTQDGPGWLTHPVETDRLRDYWTHGAGAAKIGWGAPGDFNRCRANLAKYVKPQHISGYCANRHKDALGFWPGQHHSSEAVVASGEMAPAISLVASVDQRTRPPMDWFADPGLTGPSPIVVTEDGRIFGHLATWGTCHIGFKDVCTTAPSSATDYAYFRTGAVLTAEGEQVPVGQITMGTGHAALSAKARPAAAHYDDTGFAAADVAAGEDEWGIWVSGAVRPGVSDDKVAQLRAAALSGDWRAVGGNLELVAALAVNVPGFPIPRTGLAASGGEQTALVASGVVSDGLIARADLEELVSRVVSEELAAQRRKEQMTAMMKRVGRDPKTRMAALVAARKDS